MTSTPAPCYVPWDYTPTGIKNEWVRGFVFTDRRDDFHGNVERYGIATVKRVMREEQEGER